MRSFWKVLFKVSWVLLYMSCFVVGAYLFITLWVDPGYSLVGRVVISAITLLLMFASLLGVYCVLDETVEDGE